MRKDTTPSGGGHSITEIEGGEGREVDGPGGQEMVAKNIGEVLAGLYSGEEEDAVEVV